MQADGKKSTITLGPAWYQLVGESRASGDEKP